MTDAVDTVLFDLDHTLVTYSRPADDVLAEAFDRAGVDPFFPVEAYFARYGQYLGNYDSLVALRRDCFADIAVESGRPPEHGHAVADAFCAARDQSAVDLLPGARAAVEHLADDHRLGVVTNGAPDAQEPKLRASGLADYFETVVYAGFDTLAKPDAAPFDHALDTLSSAPERAVHVGNSFGSDVAGAHAAGLRSVHVPSGDDGADGPDDGTHSPHYRVSTLDELVGPPWRTEA